MMSSLLSSEWQRKGKNPEDIQMLYGTPATERVN